MEEEFIYATEFGDIPTVQRILENNANFNVDYTDIIGRTPLQLAVGNEHLEVVDLLLERSNIANIHEALLQAISAGHENIAESILKHSKYKDVKKENKRFGETDYFFNQTKEDSPFSSDITPLILAAERNQFEIVQLLLLRGETINKPHHYYCNCQECSNKLQFDQLRLAKTRLNAYRGQASAAYISLSSKDPIQRAFELAREIRRVAKVEKYYKNEYLALADQLSEYVVKLVDKVRGHDELEILLNKKGRDSDDETYELLARLKLAIHYNEKKFVAHPSCQQKLVSIWYDDLRALERSNWFLRTLMVIGITAVYPLLAVLYMIIPRSRLGKFMQYPCIKFIGHTMSFLAFLVMILTLSVTERPSAQKKLSVFKSVYEHYIIYKNLSTDKLPDDFVVRTFEPEFIHLLLTLWIIGMLWQEMKQVYAEGIYNYFDSLYNYLDYAVLTLYITSFTLRYVTIFKVNIALEYFVSNSSWSLLLQKHSDSTEQFYWLIAVPNISSLDQELIEFLKSFLYLITCNLVCSDRFYWDSWDPHNIAEGLFAIANVISFTRVSYLLPANELFGPMQISLARMITDILKFAVIFLVVFLAFMVGLHNLYWYYPKEMRKNVEFLPNNVTTEAEGHFGIPDITFRTVFWSLFGRGEPRVVELGKFNHYFTQNVGYWIFGAYNISTVIVLLNMLIAMMSRSFEIIQEEADTEWKFARSKLYMEYIKTDATLPIPFNICPTPKTGYNIIIRIWRCICKVEDPDVAPHAHPGRIKDIEMYATGGPNSVTSGWDEESNGHHKSGIKRFQERMHTTNGFVRSDSDPNVFTEKLTYKRVMKRIVKRYIFDVQRETDISEGDFDEIKQDISSFRYEMLNHLTMRQREAKETVDRVDLLNHKVETLLQQQRLLLNALDSTKLKSNVSQRDRIDSDSPLLQQGARALSDPYDDTFQTGRSRTQTVLHDIPEEVRSPADIFHSDGDKTETPKLQRQNTCTSTDVEDVIVGFNDEQIDDEDETTNELDERL
ncbi:hypothetical protein KUTeg_019527 [Tegillarca granosa]|uniref:Transient receptor ion channel domain-containing protein n=1 Tax=Tegillarca granosa TaxID=220873 RepID=A0ABQ9EH05_TEGGR|nr:hypothetical protein KUTeg_019527 [Tegillarca granosa]